MRLFFSACLLVISILPTNAQTILTFSQAILIAQQNSLQANLNKNNYEIVNQTYRLQRAQLFPQIILNANLPGYTNSITSVTQPDGTIQFKTVEQAYSNVGVIVSQKIATTGGTFTASSNINRFDRLTGNRTTNFNSQPFVLGLNQPLFRFNELAFNLKTSKLNQLIGSKTYLKQQEQLALEVCNLFYALLQSNQQIKQLLANKLTTDTLLQTAKLKWRLGKLSEEEYLQIQLELLNTTTQLEQLKGNNQLLKIKLCNLLAMPIQTEFILEDSWPTFTAQLGLDDKLILILVNNYKSNNPDYEQQYLKRLQNDANIKRAKLNNLPNFNLTAGYGSNQSAPILNDAYQNLLTQQNATIGIAMPLYSSGANTANLKIANYQLQNLQLQTKQLEQQITNDLMKQAQSYNIAVTQISNAQFADSIAQRRYQISYNKYQAGKITYTDLLLAQNQQMQAKQSYINAVAAYWQAYYQLRVTTLYDVVKQESIYHKN